MRYLWVFIAASLWVSCGKKGSGKPGSNSSVKEIAAETLMFDEPSGLTYQVGETTPFSGKAVWRYPSGKIEQESSYLNGKEHGQEIWWNESGARVGQSEYKDGVLDGPTVQWYSDGKQMQFQTLFKNGKQHGSEIWWHSNGKEKSVTPYVNGNRQGKAKGWFEDGTLAWEAGWKDDEPHGKYSEWYQSGQLKNEKSFVMGIEDGSETWWYEHGRKSWEVTRKEGRKTGMLVEWYEGGKKMSEIPHVAGLREGVATGWYESGIKAFESTYFADEEVGIKEWLETGELVPPTPESKGRTLLWKEGHLERFYIDKPEELVYAVFGEPDKAVNGAWIFEGIKLDGGNQTLLRNVRFTFQSGKVKSVKVELPGNE
ncbi:MAG: toxin-antitoxin system YwqK family antitoxin [Opitutales bacterium]